MSPFELSLPLNALNPLRLENELGLLADGGAPPELYCPVSGGDFAPPMGHGPELITHIAQRGGCPVHVHLLSAGPGGHLRVFAEAGCRALTVHAEPVIHIHRLLTRIREEGLSPGIALKPATPLTRLDYLLEYMDRVLILTADPGFADAPRAPGALDRVRILRENLDYLKSNAVIEVQGPFSPLDAARFARMGAHRICPDPAAWNGWGGTAGEKLNRFREEMARQEPLA